MEKQIYRITFLNQGKLYELYAENIQNGFLGGFIEVSGIIFGAKGSLVVDPSEERLKAEFENVSRFQVPYHAVIRIDEVTEHGVSKIHDATDATNITPFPTSFSPGNNSSSS